MLHTPHTPQPDKVQRHTCFSLSLSCPRPLRLLRHRLRAHPPTRHRRLHIKAEGGEGASVGYCACKCLRAVKRPEKGAHARLLRSVVPATAASWWARRRFFPIDGNGGKGEGRQRKETKKLALPRHHIKYTPVLAKDESAIGTVSASKPGPYQPSVRHLLLTAPLPLPRRSSRRFGLPHNHLGCVRNLSACTHARIARMHTGPSFHTSAVECARCTRA